MAGLLRQPLLLLLFFSTAAATTYSIQSYYSGGNCDGTPYGVLGLENANCTTDTCSPYDGNSSTVHVDMVSVECSTDYIPAMRQKFGDSPYLLVVSFGDAYYWDDTCTALNCAYGLPASSNCVGSFNMTHNSYAVGRLETNGSASLQHFTENSCLANSWVTTERATKETLYSHSCDQYGFQWYSSRDDSDSGSGTGTVAITGIVCGTLALTLSILVSSVCYRHRVNAKSRENQLPSFVFDKPTLAGEKHPQGLWNDDVIIAKRVPRDKVVTQQLISRGAFGTVPTPPVLEARTALTWLKPQARHTETVKCATCHRNSHRKVDVTFELELVPSPCFACALLLLVPTPEIWPLAAEITYTAENFYSYSDSCGGAQNVIRVTENANCTKVTCFQDASNNTVRTECLSDYTEDMRLSLSAEYIVQSVYKDSDCTAFSYAIGYRVTDRCMPGYFEWETLQRLFYFTATVEDDGSARIEFFSSCPSAYYFLVNNVVAGDIATKNIGASSACVADSASAVFPGYHQWFTRGTDVDKNDGLSGGTIAGIVIGCVLVTFSIVAAIVKCHRENERQALADDPVSVVVTSLDDLADLAGEAVLQLAAFVEDLSNNS
ncbi:hypothetical protein PHYPSEUDO_003955 [Phytophthora pseudosyringae]|uniref:TKL protein kinase n=1 Tax=Phytophthora pseudosyringae TaxID=221518 RepID=A0A8T1VSH8_9STRA|nr:hypothetical protein PHYPSEUDO_003955 [Phytophthora pseudosyringae]